MHALTNQIICGSVDPKPLEKSLVFIACGWIKYRNYSASIIFEALKDASTIAVIQYYVV